MGKCLTCGKNCEKEYCFIHKPRKQMKRAKLSSVSCSKEKVNKLSPMKEFFMVVWDARKHASELSGASLGKIPSSAFFHHILPKSKFPEAAYDPYNIILLTIEEHDNVEIDMYKYDVVNEKRAKLLKKYGLK